MLKNQAQRAYGRVVGRELMVVKIAPLRLVLPTHIDDGDGGISKIGLTRFASHDGHAVHGCEEAAGEEFVFMSASGMSEDEGEGHGHLEKRWL
jgi:hypothetical protein